MQIIAEPARRYIGGKGLKARFKSGNWVDGVVYQVIDDQGYNIGQADTLNKAKSIIDKELTFLSIMDDVRQAEKDTATWHRQAH